MAEYTLTFDAASIHRMRALMGATAAFEGFYAAAMRASVNQVATRAMLNAPVGRYPHQPGHTGGHLRDNIRGFVVSPLVGVVGVDKKVPYAKRREFGYDGRKDKLGRYYPMDPLPGTVSASGDLARSHMFYLRRALIDSQPFIASAFRTQLVFTLHEMAA